MLKILNVRYIWLIPNKLEVINIKILFISFIFISNIFGNHIIHEIIHEAPNYSTCKIEAFIDLPEEKIRRFSLLYRPLGNLEYIENQMIFMGHTKYFSEIPANFMIRETVEYYLLLELFDNHIITFPTKDAIKQPILINIIPSSNNNILISSIDGDNFNILAVIIAYFFC